LSGKSCVDEEQIVLQEQAKIITTRDSIRGEFETDWLSDATLHALGAVAKQNLSDFADYSQILTDSSLDSSFREKAGEMIKEMFVSDETQLGFMVSKGGISRNITLEEWLNEGWITFDLSEHFRFDSIYIKESLRRTNPTRYKGSLEFIQTFTVSTYPDSTIYSSQKKAIDVLALRGEKVFGSDTLLVWEVFLGDME